MCKSGMKKSSVLRIVFTFSILLISLNVSAFRISVPSPSGGLKLLEKLNLQLPIYLKVDNDYPSQEQEEGKDGGRSISFLSVTSVSISDTNEDEKEQEEVGNHIHDNEMEFNTEGNVEIEENEQSPLQNESGPPEKRIFFYDLGLNLTANTGKKPNCDCGSVSSAFPAESGINSIEFPWRVLLQKNESLQAGGFCAGSILDKSWIMTSARCLLSLAAGSRIYVNVGDYDLLTSTEMDNDLIPAKSWIIHPQFNPFTNDNDIALIKLERDIIFRHNIQPVCLPYRFMNVDLTGATVLTSGWRSIAGNGNVSSSVMLKAETVYLSTIQCRNLMGISKAETISNNVICSYGRENDSCIGDTGGSLDFYDTETKRYFGLGISIGQTCTPLLYTKITNYLEFIQQVTKEIFCVK